MPRRHWTDCRECGRPHQNPMSSSLCEACGPVLRERNKREQEAAENEAWVRRIQMRDSEREEFLNLPDDEKLEYLFDALQNLRS